MKKIPTVFVRDWNGDRSRVLPEITPGCEWVVAGEGRALQKLDGTCCLIRDGRLFKRHEVKPNRKTGLLPERPSGFEPVSNDFETGAIVGWVPVGDGPEDKWHREALANAGDPSSIPDGTYELLGPKIQGNPEQQDKHVLIPHVAIREWTDVPRTFDGMRAWFESRPGLGGIEGLVFHHPDGRMAKIKGRDFGIKREGG